MADGEPARRGGRAAGKQSQEAAEGGQMDGAATPGDGESTAAAPHTSAWGTLHMSLPAPWQVSALPPHPARPLGPETATRENLDERVWEPGASWAIWGTSHNSPGPGSPT